MTIGVGASGRPLSAGIVAAAGLGLLITVGLWWTYFDRFAAIAEERLRGHADPVLAASDGYSYIHLLIVAGVIIFAVGVKVVIGDAGSPLHYGARLALCGGVALYLLGHAAFRLRLTGLLTVEKIFAIGALLALFGLSAAMPAWSVASVVSLLLAALCGLETVSGAREARLAQ